MSNIIKKLLGAYHNYVEEEIKFCHMMDYPYTTLLYIFYLSPLGRDR